MIKRACYLRTAFNQLLADGHLKNDQLPTDEEWEILRSTLDILYPFMTMQKTLEGQKM